MAIIAPEVAPEPIPSVQDQADTNLTTFGGGAGAEAASQEIQKIAGQAGDIATFERIRFDQTAVQEAKAKLSGIYSDLLYHPETGVLSSRGVNSIKVQEEAANKFKKASNDISSDLNGDAQVGAFNREALTMWEGFSKTSMAHASEEMDKHQVQTFGALVKNETDRGAFAYGDPQTRGHILNGLNTAADQYAISRGLGDEEKKLLKTTVESNFHEKTIDAMVSAPGFYPAAKEYYYANKDQIDSNTRERIEKVLGEGDTRYGAQSAVQTILATRGGSETESLKAADKIEDADQRDMARKMITARFQQNRAAEKNDQDELFTQWGQRIGKSGITDPIEIRSSIPPNVWSQLRNEQRTALMKSGQDTVTSPKKWLDFMDAVKDGNVKDLSRADLEEKYLPYFDVSDKKRAEDIWSGRKGDTKFLNAQSTQQRIETSLVNAGLVHAKAKDRSGSTRDAELIKQFDGDVVSSIDQFEAAEGRSPKPEEIQQIVDNRTRQYFADNKVKVFGNLILPNPQKPVALLTDVEKGLTYVPYSSVPTKDASTLETIMRQKNKPVTKEKVEKAYAAYIQGDKKRMRDVINGD